MDDSLLQKAPGVKSSCSSRRQVGRALSSWRAKSDGRFIMWWHYVMTLCDGVILWITIYKIHFLSIGEQKAKAFCEAVNWSRSDQEGKFLFCDAGSIWWNLYVFFYHMARIIKHPSLLALEELRAIGALLCDGVILWITICILLHGLNWLDLDTICFYFMRKPTHFHIAWLHTTGSHTEKQVWTCLVKTGSLRWNGTFPMSHQIVM